MPVPDDDLRKRSWWIAAILVPAAGALVTAFPSYFNLIFDSATDSPAEPGIVADLPEPSPPPSESDASVVPAPLPSPDDPSVVATPAPSLPPCGENVVGEPAPSRLPGGGEVVAEPASSR